MQTGTDVYYSLRNAVHVRDNHTCQYCGTTTAARYVMEHVVPERRGGVSELYNLVCACLGCNNSKGNAVWVPANIDAIMADAPEWKAWVLANADPRKPVPDTTYSVRGVDPALALAVKHAALDLGLTMREAQEAMMRDWLRKNGKEAPNG